VSSRWPRLTLHRSQLGSWHHRRAACSRWLLTYFASRSAWLVAPSMWIEQSLASYLLCRAVSLVRHVAPSACSEQSLASYLLGRAVSLARGAIGVRHADVRRAVVGFLLTSPRSQLGSWRHRRVACSRWLLTYIAAQSAGLVAPSTCSVQCHRRAARSRWLLTYIASQSAWLVAPLTCISSARGAIDIQCGVVGYLLTLPRSPLGSWRP